MIVIMSPQATPADRERVTMAVAGHCSRVDQSVGQDHVLLGLVGADTSNIDASHIQSLPGVLRVIRIQEQYRLVSRTARAGAHTIARIGDAEFGNGHVSVIAGPCAVESYDQLIRIISRVQANGATVARGDAFKARTSPYSFLGHGIKALQVIQRVREETGMPFVVDVLSANHIQAAMDHGISCLRIGARYAQNVELVQAAASQPVCVMIKRGLSMTYVEWLMMAEYAALARSNGDLNLILCERGIRTFEDGTRNTLDISAIRRIHQMSHLPIIGDPSHASGIAEDVPSLAAALVAVGADGLMIDVHDRPEEALVDGPQAIHPDAFATIMANLSLALPALV